MKYGYARVSPGGKSESVDAQARQLTKAGCRKVFRDVHVSGAKPDRAQLRRMIETLEPGDVLMVTRLDRLARSTRDLLNTLAAITERKAGFRSLSDAWADTTTSHGRLMLTVLGGLSLPVARPDDRPTEPGVGSRHHLYPDGPGLSLPGRGDGLVQPPRSGMASIEHDGHLVLPRTAQMTNPLRLITSRRSTMSAGVGMAGSDMRRDDAEEAHDRIWQRLFIAYSASAYLRRSFTKLLR